MPNLDNHSDTAAPEAEPLTRSQALPSLPPNKNFLVWLSHDVDRVRKTLFHSIYYAVKEKRGRHLSSLFSSQNPYWNFERIMNIENVFDVKSTFFFLNESMRASIFWPRSFILAKGRYRITDPSIQNVIRELDQNGWEIGVHGSYTSYDNIDLLQREKHQLETIVGHPIKGIRQHYLNLNIPQTWKIHRSLGFQYDASFGLTKDIGYRDDIYYPFHPLHDEFIVFPMAIMDSALFAQYKDIDSAWNKCLKIIKLAQEKKTLLSIIWHQRVFNEHDFPGYTEIYERLIQECLKRNAQFCTGKDIFQYMKF